MDLDEEWSKSRSEELVDEKKIETLDETKPEMISGVMGDAEHPVISAPVDAASGGGVGAEIMSGTPAESTGYVFGSPKANGDGIVAEHAAESLSKPIGSPTSASPDAAAASNSTPSKGYGLKKWRRIRRDSSKDGAGGADSAVILKRRLSLAEPLKARDESKQKSGDAKGEGSIASNAAVAATTAVAAGALDPELVLLVASSGFSVGADSDNSEDLGSKSSMATNAPRLRHEAVGFGRERSRGKGPGGRGLGHAVQQRGQRGRGGGVDASKKSRGDQLISEKENSQSSIESDLRSSNVVRWGSGLSSNGKQSERSINDVGEHGDEAQTFEEVRSGYYKENGRIGASSREDLDADPTDEENTQKSENGGPGTDLNPFAESIVLLQAAQEALETEIQKFGEIGIEPSLDDSNVQLEGTEGSSSLALQAHFLELNQKIEHLGCKLDEASATVKAKESKVLELEAILNRTHLPKEETERTVLPFLQENCKEMELELEGLIMKKIEAEIECLIITRATQSFKVLGEDQIALFEEHKSLVENQAQMMIKLGDAEKREVMLKEQAEELEARCRQLVGTEEVATLQNEVCKSSLSCFVQLVMLCVTFWWFLMQLLPLSDGVVPT